MIKKKHSHRILSWMYFFFVVFLMFVWNLHINNKKKKKDNLDQTSVSFQLIQTISAIDTDEPLVGHKFVFGLTAANPNFTIFDNEGVSG